MIFLRDAIPELWAKQCNLSLDRVFTCGKCHRDFKINIPVMTMRAKGLHTGFHGCGAEYFAVIMKDTLKGAAYDRKEEEVT